jgi:hypothetical protein
MLGGHASMRIQIDGVVCHADRLPLLWLERKSPISEDTGLFATQMREPGLCRLDVGSGILAALAYNIIANLLTFAERGHPGSLHGSNVNEHILAAVIGLNEAEAFLRIEEFDGSDSHLGLLKKRMKTRGRRRKTAYPK